MYCVILSVVIDATPFVLKMHSYLWIFFLKVRHVLSGLSEIGFAYNVTDEIVPGIFLPDWLVLIEDRGGKILSLTNDLLSV